MRLRRILAWIFGFVLGMTAWNRLLQRKAGSLPQPLPGVDQTYSWRGYDISYTEAGDPTNQTVVLLHGIHAAASAYEFRQVFEPISEKYHVITPDFPGFGRSDRPEIVYDGSVYQDFLTDFLRDVTDEPVVIASSLSGSYATAVAETADISELVLISPTATTLPRNIFVRELFTTPLIGTGLFNVLVSYPSLRYYNTKEAYRNSASIDEALLEYQWQTSHQPNANVAPASFLGGYLDPDIDFETALRHLDVPVTLIWGRNATRPPLQEGRILAQRADSRLVTIEKANGLPHDEYPEEFLRALASALPGLQRD